MKDYIMILTNDIRITQDNQKEVVARSLGDAIQFWDSWGCPRILLLDIKAYAHTGPAATEIVNPTEMMYKFHQVVLRKKKGWIPLNFEVGTLFPKKSFYATHADVAIYYRDIMRYQRRLVDPVTGDDITPGFEYKGLFLDD